jgi:hypothetical protein
VGPGADAVTAHDASYDASGKDTAEIEYDIAATRAELGTVLDALERRLALRQLVEKGMEMVKGTIEGNAGAIGDAVRAHPVPLALIGVGIGWFVVAARGGERVGRRLRGQVSGAARQAAGGASALASGAAERVAKSAPYETGEELAGYAYARTKPRSAAEAASGAAAGVRHNVGHVVDEHPLALGIVGFAAGAAIGMLLPRSRMEERVIAPARQRLKEEASALGHAAAEHARSAAGRAADAAADALRDEARRAASQHESDQG